MPAGADMRACTSMRRERIDSWVLRGSNACVLARNSTSRFGHRNGPNASMSGDACDMSRWHIATSPLRGPSTCEPEDCAGA
eukprot:361100-Chlamydomonas_euryale.AAC.20